MKKLISTLLMLSLFSSAFSQGEEENTSAILDSLQTVEMVQNYLDSIDNSFTFQKGKIDISNGLATINVPSGFKFLDAEQSERVLTDIWGNPPSSTLGIIFPENASITGDDSYAVEISYSEEGYIEDEDAEDIDYDDLLEEMIEDTKEASKYRIENGYGSVELLGWAATPFYDAENKKLHWAKEMRFDNSQESTLNYNIRILGRKGYLNLNAIGTIGVLAEVKQDVDLILASVEFNEGNTYFDFDPDFDDVAAYGIGGLIAGKILAKAGLFVLFLKFWKIIAAGAIGLFALFKNKFMGGPKERKDLN